MKFLRQGIALAVAGAGLAVIPAMQVQAQAAEPSLVQQMKSQADGDVRFDKSASTGRVSFVRTTGDLMPARAAGNAAQATAKADAYLAKYAESFGARSGEIVTTGTAKNQHGWTVSYTQRYKGLPVLGSVLRANLDEQGDLTSVNGFAAPDLSLDTAVGKSASAAESRALAEVTAHPPTSEEGDTGSVKGIKASAKKVVYRNGSTRGIDGESIVAYAVTVSNDKNVRDMVVLDAVSLKPVNRWTMVTDAMDRLLATYNDDTDEVDIVWGEGDDRSVLDEDQNNLVTSAGESWGLFYNTFGRDSFDDAGSTMVTLHNRPDSCPNASWNGAYTSYCPGVYADDIVSHEWGHAYTEYTSGLIYQWQSGALNESYSDVWGETLDLLNGREDEGEGDLAAKRPVGMCSSHSAPNPLLTIDSPATIAKDCVTGGYMGPDPLQPVSGEIAVPTDAVETGGTATDGCSAYNEDVTGKIVLVDRGLCTFVAKAENAKAAGAIGVVIGNRDSSPAGFTSGDQTLPPTVSVGLEDRELIRSTIAGGQAVQVSITDASGERFDSYRWLIGEQSTAFGGAIRDMWNPTCYGDPGKVSDAEYHCTSDDNGGVHGNSAVPNHAYSLLVDGGTYNDVTTTGIGIDKAANIYFRNQTSYLTPTSGFVEHAEGLEASCNDLIGDPINKVTVAEGIQAADPAAPITADDCAQVAKVNAAVEFRLDPSAECDWQPILDPDAPSLCGAGTSTQKIWGDDFEAGIGQWATDEEVVYAGANGYPWVASSSAPDGHTGGVAFGADPDAGDCSGGAGDISSRDGLISPVITMPASGIKAPKLSFEHYMASEAGYDGGNVKIAVNGGPFTLVPATAFVFNGYNDTMEDDTTNTSPLAGQEGFTGTNEGEAFGSWGQSQINLAAPGLDLGAGDSFRIRFDMGRDGCGGNDGWYVDNVAVTLCSTASTTTTAVHVPEPSTYGTASKADVTVSSAGGTPTGVVAVTTLAGASMGGGTLVAGKTTVALPADLPVGTHILRAIYDGSDAFGPSSTTFTVTVKAAPQPGAVDSRTKLKMFPKKPRFKQDFKAVAKVKAADRSDVDGKVKFILDGHAVGRRSVEDGRAKLRIKKDLKVGKHKLVAVYLGSDSINGSDDTVRFKVKRR